MDVSSRSLTGPGDSGVPCLFEELPGVYRLVAILYGRDLDARPPEGYAFPASRAEFAVGINFGYERRPVERRTGIPILTSEGLVGHRLLIRDYFVAGEPLACGDVVAVTGESGAVGSPSVSKVFGGVGQSSTIGIVHTSSSQSVGDLVAGVDEFVPVIIHGIARTLAASPIGIGDSVNPDFSLHAKAKTRQPRE